MKKKRTILVTGGAGFIGSHIADELLKQGLNVVVFDNLSTGISENIPKQAHFIKGDTSSRQDVSSLFREFSFDAVFQIAGNASIIQSFSNPLIDFKKNFVGTVNIVRGCLEYNVPRLLYASSMTVYGHPRKKLITENTSPVPVSYYGISKYSAERFVHATAERNDLSHPFHVTSFRMFNVYGPRQSLTNQYQGVMGIFIGNLLRREPITIFGDGDQSRDLIYIDDIVRAWTNSLDAKATFGRVFNLGYGVNISVNQMIEVLLRKFKYTNDYPIFHKPPRPGEQRHTRSDISAIKEAINWQPKVRLEDGIAKTILWAKREYEKGR
jgi:UDP-glucose 4-epimerase